ncbi:MAG TPA: CHAT domain-containing protein [Anaerolineales bacterium]|nr:CHAT domain-containing protein [Anaerolineales bacterium]
MPLEFLNFDLLIEADQPVEGSVLQYSTRLLQSPAGQARHTFQFQPANDPLRQLLTLSEAQELGRTLHRTALGEQISGLLQRSLDEARRQGKGLRLRLRLEDAPMLTTQPWELLHNPNTERTYALSSETPLVRYPELPEGAPPLEIQLPLNILVLIANPNDHPPLEVEKEWNNLNNTLADLQQRGLVTLERLETPTLNGLLKQLRRGNYHIFHFIGHGGFNPQTGLGELILEQDNGESHPVSGTRLGTFLRDERSLRLAVLNACEGAKAEGNPFASVALKLVQQGVPAVIAMQTRISDRAAIAFEHEFYSALADVYPVDAALSEARKAVFAESEVEWAVPVIYMRSESGKLFAVKGGEEDEKKGKGEQEKRREHLGSQQSVYPTSSKVRNGDLAQYASELNDLRNYLTKGRLVLFVGSDLPEELTGAPDRQTLANRLAEEKGLPLHLARGQGTGGWSLSAIAQQVMAHGNRYEFTQFLKRQLTALQPGPFYQTLAGFIKSTFPQPGTIITTAYHRLLESSLEAAGEYGLQIFAQDSMFPFIEENAPVLIKLYGDIQQADLIVTEQDQTALIRGRNQERQIMLDEVTRLFKRYSILFIGVDPNDPVVLALFDEVAGGKFQVPSFAVWTGLSDAERRSLEGNRGIKILEIEPDQLFQELTAI